MLPRYIYKRSEFNNDWEEYFTNKKWKWQNTQYEQDLALAKRQSPSEVIGFLQDLRQQVQASEAVSLRYRTGKAYLPFVQEQCAENHVPDVFDPSQPIWVKERPSQQEFGTNSVVNAALGVADRKAEPSTSLSDVPLHEERVLPQIDEVPAEGPATFQALEIEDISTKSQPTCLDSLLSCLPKSLRPGR